MYKILDGLLVAKKINNKTKNKVLQLNKCGIYPKLAVVLVGDNPASLLYTKIKKQKAKEIGIETLDVKHSENITHYELINEIEKLNNNESIHGILIQLPLPKHLDTVKILETINPKKDVDGLNPKNLGKLLVNKPFIIPPTADAIIEILNYYKINLTGKHIVLVGYGKLVGKPLAAMISLSNQDATLTICNSKTKNLLYYTKQADILISAAGVPNLITNNMVKKDVTIVDAGTSKKGNKIIGDVDFKNIRNKCTYITPSKGGVGPVTVAKLLENVVKLTNNL